MMDRQKQVSTRLKPEVGNGSQHSLFSRNHMSGHLGAPLGK